VTRMTMILAGAILSVIALAGLILATVSKVEGMVAEAARAARSERDGYWRGQVDQLTIAAERRITENLRQTMAAQDRAREEIAELEARSAELEKENAALPDGGSHGLGRERVRLLNKR